MRVTPWNQYQLVDQETKPNLHLASRKNRLVRGCASFLCFGRAAAGLESPSPLKVEPTHQHHHHQQDVLKSFPDLEKVEEKVCNSELVNDGDINGINASSPLKGEPTHHHDRLQEVIKSFPDSDKVEEKVCSLDVVHDDDTNNVNASSLRSSLKRPVRTDSVTMDVDNKCEGENAHEKEANGVDYTERRVQWQDVSGGELFVIQEYEPSEHNSSDDEFGNRNERGCLCKLM